MTAEDSARRPKRVIVLSYYETVNFGDRLGYHVLNGILPAHADVTYANLNPWTVPDRDYDLLILGIGNSLLPSDACNPRLAALMERVPHSIGIFGTQFRGLFREGPAADGLQRILNGLTTWWARYEDDITLFGGGRSNVRHLGDWLITAFPMAVPTLNRVLTIPAEFLRENVSLDRTIQKIQSYRGVSSARLHTLLCALTSADHVSYQEQRVVPGSDEISGKFGSMLIDIFGRSFNEGELFGVDREAVRRYKIKVTDNVAALREELAELLTDQ
ncbi:MAG TPA: hypothetical protein VK533_13930 [Sphingomonas sp.]|uniref:hypothetical protein n=1 Tax=Sphingomonas sp. TaxID=28214 RepID=UPI002C389860|nr:hypothetical protein [Sphingomonas sp.]HMI20633.1 hypothetical protein [Sphingomonas sp.]